MYSSELYVSHGTYHLLIKLTYAVFLFIIGYVIWNYGRVCTVYSFAITTPYSIVQTMFPVCAYFCTTACFYNYIKLLVIIVYY